MKPGASAIPLTALVGVTAVALSFQLPNPDGGPFEPGVLPAKWITGGPNCIEIPDWQVHAYNADFYILRESGCTNFEKPFLYLIFGRHRALLLDTGAGQVDTKTVVSSVMTKWQKHSGSDSISLLVLHTHAHGDHIAGDAQFENLKGVELIPPKVPDLQKACGIVSWPDDTGSIDLGARTIDVIAIPGHQEAAIALYDRRTGILLSGDHLYPGRLYVSDWPAYVASTRRLVDFTHTRPVTNILGAHIEQMNVPYRNYQVGVTYQPDEHPLELSRAHLLELDQALSDAKLEPRRMAFRDFTIWPKVTPGSPGSGKISK